MEKNYKDLLNNVKVCVISKEFDIALRDIEALLVGLKNDFLNGINKEKSGKAFNKLLPVRMELKSGIVTKKTYEILGLPLPETKKEEPKDIYGIPSDIFNDISLDEEETVPDAPSEEPEVVEDTPIEPEEEEEEVSPEDKVLEGPDSSADTYQFEWDEIPTVKFEDIAGLDDVKELIRTKVLYPLLHPEALEGYESVGGGGLCLYGPPGTGKTMMAAAIANKINAKFCTVTPSDLLHQGAGNSEKAVRSLFAQARRFKCAVIFFDEMDSIAPKSTRSQYAKQLRSELLAQLQGIQSYGKKSNNILFLICATNKPWDIDSAFLRPGRFGTKVYVSLPDAEARKYIINHRLEKIISNGVVDVRDDIDVDYIVDKTNGFNCADITNLLSSVEELSFKRNLNTGDGKYISNNDFIVALRKVPSTVQKEDIVKLNEWKSVNDIVFQDDDDFVPSDENEPVENDTIEDTPNDTDSVDEDKKDSDDSDDSNQ